MGLGKVGLKLKVAGVPPQNGFTENGWSIAILATAFIFCQEPLGGEEGRVWGWGGRGCEGLEWGSEGRVCGVRVWLGRKAETVTTPYGVCMHAQICSS